MPEPVVPVKEPDEETALIPLKDDTRSAALAQADRFITTCSRWRDTRCLRITQNGT
jgi:hypothetical protein